MAMGLLVQVVILLFLFIIVPSLLRGRVFRLHLHSCRYSYRSYRSRCAVLYCSLRRIVVCDQRLNYPLHLLSMPLASFSWKLWLRSPLYLASWVTFKRLVTRITRWLLSHFHTASIWRAAWQRWWPWRGRQPFYGEIVGAFHRVDSYGLPKKTKRTQSDFLWWWY